MDKALKCYKFPDMMIDTTPDNPNNSDQTSDNNNRNGHNGTYNGDTENTKNIIRIPSAAERQYQQRKDHINNPTRHDHPDSRPSEKMINLPPMTKTLLGLIIIPHVVMTLILSPPQQYWIMAHFGFIPAAYTQPVTDWFALIGVFTYMFLHASWLHLGMNAAMLIAFGAGLERWMGGTRLFIFFYICALAGAVFHFIIAPTSPYIMIGASGGISGLFGAVMVMLSRERRIPLGKYGLWPLIIFWVVLSLVFGVIGAPDGSNIAWAAHIGGFLFGLLMITPFMAYRRK